MISVCCCSMNSKFETEVFIDALYFHNQGFNFEVCLVHDDRVDDGAGEYFAAMQKRYPTLKVIKSTKQDAIDYLEGVIHHYETRDLFSHVFRNHLRSNLEKYKAGTLYDPAKTFLWLPSGWLYNKAVKHSSGDILVISPADYVYLFRLKDLEAYMKNSARNGICYCKPNGLRRTVSNSPESEVRLCLDTLTNPDHFQILRDYMNYPASLQASCVPDHQTKEILRLSDPQMPEKAAMVCSRVNDLMQHHGSHYLTRQAYDAIGGLSEEFYGRAFADDKMSYAGRVLADSVGLKIHLSYEFSFAWTPRSTVCAPVDGERLLRVDPWANRHPVIWGSPIYMDHQFVELYPNGCSSEHYDFGACRALPNAVFKVRSPTVRIVK